MKKLILKNVAILTFALFGLGIIGHNVFAKDALMKEGNDDAHDSTYCEGLPSSSRYKGQTISFDERGHRIYSCNCTQSVKKGVKVTDCR